MKPRPPSLRLKRRYILIAIIPTWKTFDAKRIYREMKDSISVLLGDVGIAQIQPTIVFFEHGFLIVRCRRGTERMLNIALSTVTTDGEQRIVLRTIATSGTILALKRKMKFLRQEIFETSLNMHERDYLVFKYAGQKVDLLEKGIKSQELLFLTVKDIEEM